MKQETKRKIEISNLHEFADSLILIDNRIDRCKKHQASTIVLIAISAVICGADTWNSIEDFGKSKESFFAAKLSNFNGIPSHDTFNRFFSALDPLKFEYISNDWSALGRYLQRERRVYTLCEDTFGGTLDPDQHLLDEQLTNPRGPYRYWGDSPCCRTVESEDAARCSIFGVDKLVTVSKAQLLESLTEEEKAIIRRAADPCRCAWYAHGPRRYRR